MSEEMMEITTVENWRPRVLIIGGVLGALVGVAAAYLLIQRAEEDKPPKMNVGEGVKLGVMVFGLLRSIASL
jgi:hypothetical protein